jgi:sigma-B regulation protein RsbU (phosphoserine phosphatase)
MPSPSPSPEPSSTPARGTADAISTDGGCAAGGHKEVLNEIIAARAHDKWVLQGCPSGTALRDWLEAEAEVNLSKDLALQLAEVNAQLQAALTESRRREEELKQAEELLRNSEAMYHSLVETLPVCIFRKDLNGRFTFANQAFCSTLRRPLSFILGKTDLAFYPGELAQKYIYDDRQVMETREVLEAIEEHQRPEGERTYVRVLKAPVYDSRGEVVGMQAIFWDITARMRAEGELARTEVEFRVARRIQQKLFPNTIPRVPGMDIGVATYGFDIGGASFPAEAIGGDYYDFIALGDGSLGIAIGDVSGHGVGPALLMAEARALLRAFAQTHSDVSEILGLINRVLVPDVDGDRFITMLLAKLDPRTRTLVYASAGHQTAFLIDPDGALKRSMPSTGIPLGIREDTDFPACPPIPMQSGDIVLLVTDGVVEARAPDGVVFGSKRAVDLVRVYRKLTARRIVDNLYHAVRAFARDLPQYDDITATVIKVQTEKEPPARPRQKPG